MPDSAMHLLAARQVIDEATNEWSLVAEMFIRAYSGAYESQAAFLRSVRKGIEDDIKAANERTTLVLNIVTGGVLGSLGKRFIGQTGLSGIDDIKNQLSRNVVIASWTKNALDVAVKHGEKRLNGYLESAVRGASLGNDAFAPVAMTPMVYASRLKSGILTSAVTMQKIARFVHENFSDMPEDAAKQYYFQTKASAFSQIPSVFVSDEYETLLTKRAEMARWIAWGSQRSMDYWRSQYFPAGKAYGESQHWVGLPKRFNDIGLKHPTTTILSGLGRMQQVVDMPAFITNCKGNPPVDMLVEGLRR